MNREELVNQIMLERFPDWWDNHLYNHLYEEWSKVLNIWLDVAEPIIRADESAKSDKLAALCGELLVERERLWVEIKARSCCEPGCKSESPCEVHQILAMLDMPRSVFGAPAGTATAPLFDEEGDQ